MSVKCTYCNREDVIIKSKYSDVPTCKRHIQQLKKNGKILNETIYDKNNIIEKEDYALVELKDRFLNVVGYAKIDLHDVKKVSEHKWCMEQDSNYVSASIKRKRVRLHRFLLELKNSKLHVDHINNDKLDNRSSNLRICTNAENSRNKSRTIGGTDVIGVNKQGKIFRVRLKKNYETLVDLKFDNFEDAVKARLKAEIEYFGEFAPQKHLFEKYNIK